MKVKWTRCTDKLPKDIDRYLVMTLGGQIVIDLRTPDRSDYFNRYWASHWAPLPKPYYNGASEEYLKKYPWVYIFSDIYKLFCNGYKRFFTCTDAGIVGYAEIVLPRGADDSYARELLSSYSIVAVMPVEI